MDPLIHLIYCSAATAPMTDEGLQTLLAAARAKNARLGVTGMLLHENGSFFQVLEGPGAALRTLFEEIKQDPRHAKVATIINEPIAKRAFGEWTMGYSTASAADLDRIVGLNDFFTGGSSFTGINPGRAKKLLAAFRDGRWRTKVKYTAKPDAAGGSRTSIMQPATMATPKVSFAFQPVIDTQTSTVAAYEAIVRGQNNEEFPQILPLIGDSEWSYFDTGCRAIAISMAAKLGLDCALHLNFVARRVDDAHCAIAASLDAAEKNGIEPSRIVLRIDQDKLIGERQGLANIVEEYRGAGLRISIDHFGAGRASLNMLELMRPEMILLDGKLIRDIDSNGPRQAIVRGIVRTCRDLGIDIVTEGVETEGEFLWCADEGIELFQGFFFAKPGFEHLPVAFYPTG